MKNKKNWIITLCIVVGVFLSGTAQANSACTLLRGEGADGVQPKINILFIAFGYREIDTLQQFMKEMVESSIESVEPLQSNSHLFNLWFVSHPSLPDRSNLNDVKEQLAKECGAENMQNVYEISYSNRVPANGGPAGIASIGEGSASILFRESKRTYNEVANKAQQYLFLHEVFGHAVAGLVDEYTSDSEIEERHAMAISEGKNCFVGTYEACLENAPWKDLIGRGCGDPDKVDCANEPDAYKEVSCYEGCRALPTGAFRPHTESIMNEKKKDFFGLVHQREICEKLQEQTGRATGYCYDEFGIGVEPEEILLAQAPIGGSSLKNLIVPVGSGLVIILAGILIYLLKRGSKKDTTSQ